MAHLTRIASFRQTNPVPIPETAHLTPAQRAEYTFIFTNGDDQYLIPEMEARRISSLTEFLDIGSVYYFLGT